MLNKKIKKIGDYSYTCEKSINRGKECMFNHFLPSCQPIQTYCREACKIMVPKNCSICFKEFHNKSNLNRHMESVHSKDEEMDSDTEEEDESENEEENNEWIIDIWDMLRNKAKNTNNSLKNVYKYYVLLVKSFKHDEIHQKVMETVKRAQDEDEMDFREALDYAISKRTFLINRQNGADDDVDDDDDEDDDEEMGDNKQILYN